jgi:type IV secretory pathway VirB4 component
MKKADLADLRDLFQRLWPGLPFEQPSGNEVDGQVRIGTVKNTNVPFSLNLDEINQHLLITGRVGSGKTTIIYLIMMELLKAGIPFLAFDFKQDYRHLLSLKI